MTDDVFFSFVGPDRDAARALHSALRRRGVRVWLDETLPVGRGITAGITAELNAAKVMLVLYSAAYPLRSACQLELTAAYLAGEREGDPLRRIVVINPERYEHHLRPVQLADAKFARYPMPADDRAIAALAEVLAGKVASIDGAFGDIDFTRQPRWYPGGTAGVPAFAGRYREQWELHTELHRVDFPLVTGLTGGPVVALAGLAGIGKSALASAYGWHFGSAFPGGVFRTALSGATADAALARYGDEVRRIAVALGLPNTGAGRAELTAAVADHLHTAGEPALWIIDDVPRELDRDTLKELLLPAGTVVRTILIGREDVAGGIARLVDVGAMSLEDSVAMLRMFREPDDGEDDLAAERVARRLGGHPFSLEVTAGQLVDRQSLRSFADQLDRIDSDPAALESRDRSRRRCLRRAGRRLAARPAGRRAARAHSRTGHGPGFDRGSGTTRQRTGRRPGRAAQLRLAGRTEDRWLFHAIVLDAARRVLPPAVPVEYLVSTTADLLTADEPTALLAPHLAALADHDRLDAERSARLRRRLVEHFRRHGEPVAAAGQWDRLLAAGAPAAADLLAAATAHLDAGGYERAIELARRVRAPDGERLVAQGLDALGRLGEADGAWSRVVASPSTSVDGAIATSGAVAFGVRCASRATGPTSWSPGCPAPAATNCRRPGSNWPSSSSPPISRQRPAARPRPWSSTTPGSGCPSMPTPWPRRPCSPRRGSLCTCSS